METMPRIKYGDHYPTALTDDELVDNARTYMSEFQPGLRADARLTQASIVMTNHEPWDRRYRVETCYAISYRQDGSQRLTLVNASDQLYKALWPNGAAFVRLAGKTYPMLVISARDVRDDPISPYSGIEWPNVYTDPSIILGEWDTDVEIGPRKCYYITVNDIPQPE